MKVYNINKDNSIPYGAIYIGRGSPWGNPYVIGVNGSRLEVIAKYRAYAERMLKANPNWLKPLVDADGLVCYCKPEKCHGDVIINLISK